MLTLLFMLAFQNIDVALGQDWEAMARPWMTAEETTLYDQLSPSERVRFRGFFAARRAEDPKNWSKTGLYQPYFYAKRVHGDVRDQILTLLGEPQSREANASDPSIPSLWRYTDFSLRFKRKAEGGVTLARDSETAWDARKQALIKHPEIRYDFRISPFGRTRLIEDMVWRPATVIDHWLTTTESGSELTIRVSIPESFRSFIREQGLDPVQQMEAWMLLQSEEPLPAEELQRRDRVRHGSQTLNLLTETVATFTAQLPPGFHQVDLMMYSGFMTEGLMTRRSVFVAPPELPRIGDPIISQYRRKASAVVPDEKLILIDHFYYKPSPAYDPDNEAYVLVKATQEKVDVWAQTDDAAPTPLQPLKRDGEWRVFALPAQKKPVRLIALGDTGGPLLALSSRGSTFGKLDEAAPNLKEQNVADYLTLSELNLENAPNLTLLWANGLPYAASRDGRFPWAVLDWGETVRLRFEYARGDQWRAGEYRLNRDRIFEQLRVQPKFIVAGVRKVGGGPEKGDVEVLVDGQPAKILNKTPLADLPKLWGVVVNDALLKSPEWPTIREGVLGWIKSELKPDDMAYVVHISTRPELIQPPTKVKALLQASVQALRPRTRNENVFTVRYLIDAITHLKEHRSRTHQVLLLTHQLTDEVQQMQNLIPVLRQTGLQIYNLEFPFAFQLANEEQTRDAEKDRLEEMAVREEIEQLDNLAMRREFLEDRNVLTPVVTYRFGQKKAERLSREERMRQEAFRASFNEQLASLTAGMAATSAEGQTRSVLTRFLDELTLWQQNLVHLELLEKNLTEDRVRVVAPAEMTAFWNFVGYTPGAGR